MKVTALRDAEPRPRRVAVGTFDGVHLGHREVIRGNDTVLTFEPHPLAVVRPDALPKLIASYEIKRDLIAGLGVEELVVISFDREFSKKPADQFIDEVLVERLRGEKRFESVDDLVAQMELDVQQAREICSATVFRR